VGEILDDGMLASIASEYEFLALGLAIAKYEKWEKHLPHRQIAKFKEKCGVIPKTYKMMWNDMRVSPLQECKLPKNAKLMDFLVGMRFIFTYDGEGDIGPFFGVKSEKIALYE